MKDWYDWVLLILVVTMLIWNVQQEKHIAQLKVDINKLEKRLGDE